MTFKNQNQESTTNAIFLAIENSCYGFYWMNKNSSRFRLQLLLVATLVIISFIINVNALERTMLISSLFLTILTTTLSLAMKVILDRISQDNNELSSLAKDISSAAVFISFTIAAIVWLGILLAHT